MELIDLYVREVGLRLPKKMRGDIEKEIRSMVEDSLEDESIKQARPVDKALVVQVLKQIGSPDKVASSYLPPRYLIGPELFPSFLGTLSWVLPTVAVLVTLGLGSAMAISVHSLGELVHGIANVVGGVLYALANAIVVVIAIFAMVQWTIPLLNLKPAEWDPVHLKSEQNPDRMSIAGAIFEAACNILFGLILVQYPQWIGFSMYANGIWSHVPLLAPAFFRYIPGILAVLILGTILSIWRAGLGRWTPSTRWGQVILDLAILGLTAWMLIGPPILAMSSASISAAGWNLSAQDLEHANASLNLSARVFIGLTFAFTLIDAGGQLFNLVLRDRLPPALAREE